MSGRPNRRVQFRSSSSSSSDESDFLTRPPREDEQRSSSSSSSFIPDFLTVPPDENEQHNYPSYSSSSSQQSSSSSSPEPTRHRRKQPQPKRRDRVMEEISRLVNSVENCIPRLSFQRESSEMYIVFLFQDAQLICSNANRATVLNRDWILARHLKGAAHNQ